MCQTLTHRYIHTDFYMFRTSMWGSLMHAPIKQEMNFLLIGKMADLQEVVFKDRKYYIDCMLSDIHLQIPKGTRYKLFLV